MEFIKLKNGVMNKSMNILSFLLLCGFLMFFGNLQGQDSLNTAETLELLEGNTNYLTPRKQRRFTAYEEAGALQDGALIVLLRSNSKHLKQLEILSRSSEYSEKQQRNILKKIAVIKKETQLVNQALIKGFEMMYGFSTVYYTYDTCLTAIRNGIKKGVFLDKSGVIDQTITIQTDTVLLCKYGMVSTSQEKDGLIVTDLDNNKIKAPFPSVIVSGNSGILLFLNLFTSDEVYAKRSIARDIEKLERRLFELIQMGKEEFEKP